MRKFNLRFLTFERYGEIMFFVCPHVCLPLSKFCRFRLGEEQCCYQRRRQDFGSGGGNILGGRPSRGSGGGAPRTPENFLKFGKNFLRKLQYMHNFSYLSTKFNELCVKFSHIWTKNTIVWETFEKILKVSLRK